MKRSFVQKKLSLKLNKTKDIHQHLVDRCKTGDHEAQLQIYNLYYKAMYNTSYRIVNDTAEAEDVMQNSFLEAFRKLPKFRGESTFGAWLKRIVINNSIDAAKKKKPYISLEAQPVDVIDNQQANEEDVEINVQRIKQAIKSLPDDYRVVLTLNLLEGYDHEEISQILNISNNSSRTRFHRAKKKLLQILEEQTEPTVNSKNQRP